MNVLNTPDIETIQHAARTYQTPARVFTATILVLLVITLTQPVDSVGNGYAKYVVIHSENITLTGLFTSVLVHVNMTHLLVNILVFSVPCFKLIPRYSTKHVLAATILAGVTGNITALATAHYLQINAVIVGASGGITGAVAAIGWYHASLINKHKHLHAIAPLLLIVTAESTLLIALQHGYTLQTGLNTNIMSYTGHVIGGITGFAAFKLFE